MVIMTAKECIIDGSAVLGFEFGSTRIKATVVSPDGKPIASGSHGWENRLQDGIWTYDLEAVWEGAASCYADLLKDIQEKYGVVPESFGAAGFSGMMHGYLAFDKNDNLLTPFRTWRNNITDKAARELTELFAYPIPQRWSIAHLYHAITNEEKHLNELAYLTTLAGYVHWKLTGRKVIGIGDASGMFPVDISTADFDAAMMARFDRQTEKQAYPWKIKEVLPEIIPAGSPAGTLTEEGAKLLDRSGNLKGGIPLCPPEGDAGTGMVATNSVRVRTGNVSAGTSVFAMLVLEKNLSRVHHEIDLVTTPDGKLVGMAHSNNCSSDIDAWIALFAQAARVLGAEPPKSEVYDKLLALALDGDSDAGGLLSYGYVSGEHMTGFSEGRPLFVRSSDSSFSLENFMRNMLFSSLCALRTGLNILFEEGASVEEIRGHGGFFKTAEAGQRIMAAATGTPVSLLDTAGEGGSWGMALLASYLLQKSHQNGSDLSLPDFLDPIFEGSVGKALAPHPEDLKGFEAYFKRYHKGLPIERAAVESLH
jgi:sugar (pentulose or hexulose) kinase